MEVFEDEEHPSRLVNSRIEGKVQKINEIVRKDRRSEQTEETVKQTLYDELNMKDWFCGNTTHGFCTRTTSQLQCPVG